MTATAEKLATTSCCKSEHHGAAHFSRASHFILILAPMALGVIYILARDYWVGQSTPSQGITDSIRISLLYGRTAWLRMGILALWLFGIGGGLFLVKGLSTLEKWEEAHLPKN